MTTSPHNKENQAPWLHPGPPFADRTPWPEQVAKSAEEAIESGDYPSAVEHYERMRFASLQAAEHTAYIELTLRLATLMRKLGDMKMTTAYLGEAVLYNEIAGSPVDTGALRVTQTEDGMPDGLPCDL